MCGFPIMHLDKSIKVLVQQNKRFVAMCEEFPIYSGLGVKEFERRVTRVITPGTLIDESFLNQYENNYILSVSASEAGDDFGLAWMDVSTGEFYSKTSDYPTLRDDITRIGPHEIVLDKSHERDTPPKFFEAFSNLKGVISYIAQGHIESRASSFGEDPFPSDPQLPVPDEITHIDNQTPSSIYTPQESLAIDLLTSYLRANLLENMPPIQLPNREDMKSRMQIDSHTIDALEIRESLSGGGKRGSLLSVIKRTVTDSGTRLLARWLCSPSTSLTEINARQSLVAFFCDRPHLRADLLDLLRKAEDAGRLVQKFLLGRGDSSHLHLLGTTMKLWDNIQLRIQEERQLEAQNNPNFHSEQWRSLDALVNRMADVSILSQRISLSILPYTEQEDNNTDLEMSNEEPLVRGPPKLRFNPGSVRGSRFVTQQLTSSSADFLTLSQTHLKN
jgi:DNA mismatch repair ATPase MutS